MKPRKRVIPAIIMITLQFVFAATALACPWCDTSPNGFQFCKYYASVNVYDCIQRVADEWTGRTECAVCGYCNGYYPWANQPCVAEFDDDYVKNQHVSLPACSLKIADHNLSWVGARIDQIAIF